MKYLLLFLLMLGFASACIDINSASLGELDDITWVGPATAQKIIDARPFESVDDLIKVSGIGEVKVSDIKSEGFACVDGEVAAEEKEIIIKEAPGEEIEEIGSVNNAPAVLSLDKKEVISLVSKKEQIETVYESKNYKTLNFAPYILSLILIVIVVVLAWDKF